jgi:hypothetical protein
MIRRTFAVAENAPTVDAKGTKYTKKHEGRRITLRLVGRRPPAGDRARQ